MGEAAASGTPEGDAAVVAGKYHVFADIGRGGMADVYLAAAQGPMGFNKLVVVKRLRPALSDDATLTSMFLDEARLAARLNHANIVHTYEVGKYDGGYFIAMEYVEGQSLAAMAVESGRRYEDPGARVWARICADALEGLHYAHEVVGYDGKPLGVIHRDVSPHNILIGYDGEVKLVDFGIAKASINTTITEGKTIKGKVAYMAPEQAEGLELDRRADVFAMGVVLWGLVAGERLFGGDAVRALDKLRNGHIPRLSEVATGVHPALDAAVAKALERDPAKRFQTAEEMKDALEDYLRQDGPVRSREVGALVSRMFAEAREATRRQVQRYMSELDPRASIRNLAVLRLGPAGAGRSPTASGSDITAPGAAEGTPLASHSSVKMPRAERLAPRRTGTLGVTIGGGVVVVIVAAMVFGRASEKPVAVPAAGNATATATATGTATATTTGTATETTTGTGSGTETATATATASASASATASVSAAGAGSPTASRPTAPAPTASTKSKPALDTDPWRR
jgi:serine/threonine protein kinase